MDGSRFDRFVVSLTTTGSRRRSLRDLLPAPRSQRSSTAGRAVAFRTKDAHGLYGQLGFLTADEAVMQRPQLAET